MEAHSESVEYRDLDDVARRFARWRRRGGRRIPDELWRLAAEAAKIHGVGVTVRRLRLNASRLKEWMQAGEKEASTAAEPSFVELPPLEIGGECILELEEPSGRKLRVCLKGPATRQALPLGRCLWRGE